MDKSPNPSIVKLAWHEVADKLIANHRLIMLVGEPGTGKSTWANLISCKMTGAEPEMIQGTPDTEMNHLFGFFALVEGATQFCDGPLPLALKKGRYLLVEEFNLIPLEARSSLLALRARPWITNPFTGERLTVSHGFRLIATSNRESITCARHSAVARALFDDFLTLEIPCLSGEQIREWLKANYPQAAKKLVKRVVYLWDQYCEINSSDDAKRKLRLSYRAADHLIKLLLAGLNESAAVEVALVNKYIIDEDAHNTAKLQASLKA